MEEFHLFELGMFLIYGSGSVFIVYGIIWICAYIAWRHKLKIVTELQFYDICGLAETSAYKLNALNDRKRGFFCTPYYILLDWCVEIYE